MLRPAGPAVWRQSRGSSPAAAIRPTVADLNLLRSRNPAPMLDDSGGKVLLVFLLVLPGLTSTMSFLHTSIRSLVSCWWNQEGTFSRRLGSRACSSLHLGGEGVHWVLAQAHEIANPPVLTLSIKADQESHVEADPRHAQRCYRRARNHRKPSISVISPLTIRYSQP